jgi:hypothetical protein
MAVSPRTGAETSERSPCIPPIGVLASPAIIVDSDINSSPQIISNNFEISEIFFAIKAYFYRKNHTKHISEYRAKTK